MQTTALKPKVAIIEELDVLNFPAAEQISVVLDNQDTGGNFSLFSGTVPPNVGQPPHVHQYEDEVFCVLEGELTIQAGEEQYIAKAGTVAFLPKHIPHTYHNHSAQMAKVLVFVTPSGMEGFLTESLALMANGADMVAMGALAEKYGVGMEV